MMNSTDLNLLPTNFALFPVNLIMNLVEFNIKPIGVNAIEDLYCRFD
ncbi:hypothetical protein H8S90_22505 [Olivibacter sp. SDN3]|nr:hypothetical protein [Olivibacter sp. SDN3]QNL49468.1 hypothetical protein H8S90_22505 [Olivibacter sp. SDN3]